MDRERELALRVRLKKSSRLSPDQLKAALPEFAGELDGGELLIALEELRDLIGDESGEPDMFLGAPIKPRPHRNSGAIALPEPDEPSR